MMEDNQSQEKNQRTLVKAFDELLKRYLLFFEMFDLLSVEFTIDINQKTQKLPLSQCLIACEKQYNLEQKKSPPKISFFITSNNHTSTDGYLVNRYINHLQQVINKLCPTIPILLKLLSAHYQLLLWATLSDSTLIDTKRLNHKSLLFSTFDPKKFENLPDLLNKEEIKNENWFEQIQSAAKGINYYQEVIFSEKEKNKISSILNNENEELEKKFNEDSSFKNFSAKEFQQAAKLLKEELQNNLTESENGKLFEKIELAENCLLSFQKLAFSNETVEQIKKQIGSENSNQSLVTQIQITPPPTEADIVWDTVKEYCLNAIDLQDKALILMRMDRDKKNLSEKFEFNGRSFIKAIGLPEVLQNRILEFAKNKKFENTSPKAQAKQIIKAYFKKSNHTSIKIKNLKKSLNENKEKNLSKYLKHWAFLFNDPANEQFLINVACTDIGRETSEVTVLEKILQKMGQQPKIQGFFKLFQSSFMAMQNPVTEILKNCKENVFSSKEFNFSELFKTYDEKLKNCLETANQINQLITEISEAVKKFLEDLAQIDNKEFFKNSAQTNNNKKEFDIAYHFTIKIVALRQTIDTLTKIVKQYRPHPVLADRKLKEISQCLMLPTLFPNGLQEYANSTLYPVISMVLALIHTDLENIIGIDMIIQQKMQILQLLINDKIERSTPNQKQKEEINFEQQINIYYHTLQITPVRLIDHVFSLLTNYFEFPTESKLKNLAAFFQQARKRIIKYQQYYIEEIAFNSKYEKQLIESEQLQTANNLLSETHFSQKNEKNSNEQLESDHSSQESHVLPKQIQEMNGIDLIKKFNQESHVLPKQIQEMNGIDLIKKFNEEISTPENIQQHTPGEVFLTKVDLLEFLLQLTVNKTENPEKWIEAWIEERQLILDLQKKITQFITPLALTDCEKIGRTSFPTSDKSYQAACQSLEKLGDLKFPHHFYRLQHLANHWLNNTHLPATNLQNAFLDVPSLAIARKLLNEAEKKNLQPHKLLQLKLKLVFLAYASFKFTKEVIDKAVYETFYDERNLNLDKIIDYCGESQAPKDPVNGSYEMKANNFLSSFKDISHSSISTSLPQLQISNRNSTGENEEIEIIHKSPISNNPPQSQNSSSNPSTQFSINGDYNYDNKN